jgi:hypothetical protein
MEGFRQEKWEPLGQVSPQKGDQDSWNKTREQEQKQVERTLEAVGDDPGSAAP